MENVIVEVKDYNDIEDYSIKIVVVGDSGVGKSNILTRYAENQFNQDSKATVGVELHNKTYKINDKIIKVHLWDTAGQERYKSITAAYYRGAKGAMIVYDITRPETFNNVDKWFNEIRENGEKNVQLLLVGNKSDLRHLRAVDNRKSMEKAETLGLALMETSALDAYNVEEAFKKLINGILYLICRGLRNFDKGKYKS
jgi:Ras-related protein Rab-11A